MTVGPVAVVVAAALSSALCCCAPAFANASHEDTSHASPANGEPAPVEPLPVDHAGEELGQALRALSSVQARIAAGRAAPAEQMALLQRIADLLPLQPSGLWTDSRNARALASFLFNGGNPAAVRAAIATAEIAAAEKPLVDGALAYAEGRSDVARAALMPLDPRTVPGNTGGHLALVQAALLAPFDANGALQRLDLARLLAPGTLIEEAALRRSTFLLSGAGSIAVLADTVQRYRLRFGASAYAANFESRVQATVLERWLDSDAAARGFLAEMARPIAPEARASLWLSVARRALVAARPELVQQAVALSREGSSLPAGPNARADLYTAAAALFDISSRPASQSLASFEGQVASADRDLLRAARLIAANIEAPMPAPPADSPVAERADGPAVTIARAQALLRAAR